MKYLFTKLSEPSYEKVFSEKYQVLEYFIQRVCRDCEDEAKLSINTLTLSADECNDKLLYELLSTACGCEYDLERIEE